MHGWRPALLAFPVGIAATLGGCGRTETAVGKPATLASARIAIWKCDCQHPQERWAAAAETHPTCPCGPRCDCDHGPLAVYRVELVSRAAIAGAPGGIPIELVAKAEAKDGAEPTVLSVRWGTRPPLSPTPGRDGAPPGFTLPVDADRVAPFLVTLRVRELAQPVEVSAPRR